MTYHNKEDALPKYKSALKESVWFDALTQEEKDEAFQRLNNAELKGRYEVRWNQLCRIYNDFLLERITFETYPDMFSDYENLIENKDYDTTIRLFTVPYSWYLEWLGDVPEDELEGYKDADEHFHDTCTWDDTWQMYEDAIKDNVLIREKIMKR